MRRAYLLVLGILSELGVFLLLANDPDGFVVANLLDFAHLHYESLEVLLAAVSAVFYVAILVANRDDRRTSAFAA